MSNRSVLPDNPLIMPAGIGPVHVISLVEDIAESGGRIRASKLASDLGADLTLFPSILQAAEMLGLVVGKEGEIRLTAMGLRLQGSRIRGLQMLKDNLAGIEPLKTALEIANKGETTTAAHVANVLLREGIAWQSNRVVLAKIADARNV